MTWKHEEYLKEDTVDVPVSALADPVGHEGVEPPPRRIFGSPSPVEQHEQSVNVNSVSLENGHAEICSASNPRDMRFGRQVLRPIIG